MLVLKSDDGSSEAEHQASTNKCDVGDTKRTTLFQHKSHDASEPESESDMEEEEDVKVCDICGDAGREDLLAVCSRCSDGAEHTYCMRQKLDKVPDGDWLCEECKCDELLEARKLDSYKKLGSHERSKLLGRTNSLLSDPSLKLDSNDPSYERPKLLNGSLNRQASSKRSGEKMECCPTTKKQALESSMGSPTMSSPSRMAVLSKDGSFKNLEKFKGKPSNQISTESPGDSSEDARSPSANSPHVQKGNFLKSNSFSSSVSKQNVKVSEDNLRKHGVDAKDGLGKFIGKSMSFKGLGRSSSIEPKVKMLPAKCTLGQDSKGQKHGRERTSFERRNLIKSDHSLPGQIAANSTKRPSRATDGLSTLSVTNIRDKNVQTDVKLSNISKPAEQFAQNSSDLMTGLGEVNRASTVIAESTSVNGTGDAFETKLNPFSVKDGSMVSSSRTADESLNGARSYGQESQNEKASEGVSGRSRQGVNSGMVNGNRRRLPSDTSALKTKDGLHEENKLKAAIEAAMQKKQDIFKKSKIPEKPNGISIPNSQGYNGGNAVSNQVRDSMSEEAIHEGSIDLQGCNLNPRKQISLSRGKLFKMYHADFEKSLTGESDLTVSAIPEQDSVWQGGFEIHRNGKLPDICGGFQAHMSRFASGKVFEVVGKLPQKIIFNEVPRPCAWPVQFKEFGAREDNIALYFFAKDTESYMRSYKILVDYMMKHDLALRGNVNGAELLVFPSNHLPHKSKCWNTLYFIWGVFRGRRPRIPENKVGSGGKCEISVSDTVMVDQGDTSVENRCLNKPAAEQCGSSSNGGCYKGECLVGSPCLDSPSGTIKLNEGLKNHCTSSGRACSESGSAALRNHCQESPNRVNEHQKLIGDINRGKSLPSEVMLNKQDCCAHPSKLPLVSKQESGTVVIPVKSQVLDTECEDINIVKSENGVKQEKLCLDNMHVIGERKVENDIDKKEDMKFLLKNEEKPKPKGDLRSEGYVDINVSADSNDDLQRLSYSPQRHSHKDSDGAISLTTTAVTCQKRTWADRIDMSEDVDQAFLSRSMKGFESFSGCDLSFADRSEPQMGGVSSSSHMEEISNQADIEKSTATTPGSPGGCFFHGDSNPVHSIQPQEGSLLENEDWLPGGSPNLELALGVKRRQAREGLLPFFAGVDDRIDPDRLPDVVASSKDEEGDASASLSLSLGFPFPDKGSMAKPDSSTTTAEKSVSTRHEINTSLLLFRGSSGQ